MMGGLKTALLGAALVLVHAGSALAAGIVPLSGSQQFDKDSSPPAYLVGGKLYVYQPGTTTCAAAYSDFALTTLHPCPIILNAAGRIPAIYAADGSVRLRLRSATDVLQYDEDNVAIVTAAATSGGTTPIPDSTQIFGTRDLKVRFDDQPISGYVRLNGRTIGSALSGASERANADTQSLFLGLWGYANVSVVTGKGASAAADWAANKQLTLPDMAGRLLGAMDDLGAGAKSRITAATITGPTLPGSAGGTETKTLDLTQIPSHTHTLTDTGHTHGTSVSTPALTDTTFATEAHTGTPFTGAWKGGSSGAIAPAVTGITIANAGGGAAHGIMPPVMLLCFYIKL